MQASQKSNYGIWLQVQFPRRPIAFTFFFPSPCDLLECKWFLLSASGSTQERLRRSNLAHSQLPSVALSTRALFSLSISAVDRIDFAAAGNCTTARGSFNFLLPSLYTLTKYYYTVIRSQCETQPLRCGWFTDRKWSPPLAEKASLLIFTFWCNIFTLFWSSEISTKTSLKRENSEQERFFYNGHTLL